MTRTSHCRCGQVQCVATGDPILSTVCYCTDCQAGGHLIEALPGAAPVLDPDGGTAYLTYRDDRFAVVAGKDLIVGYRLKDDSPTQRFVASCCNSGMFVKFAPGHWTSTYRHRFDGLLPPVEMRTKVGRRTSGLPLPDDVPAYRGFPLRLFWRLLTSRLVMLVGR
ncbi:MAG: hypothetical protein J0I47_15460 [Sphingomonas sp.]|uniref:GFA family protein n=1 Tax=Sphingomonas sp. TaxID=28214 RepID=UPI001AC20CDE|nr:hypothetical protein [Sphingomonas sp.]MBN8809616.1 hypothetical protein [Sphingomonas sp.]